MKYFSTALLFAALSCSSFSQAKIVESVVAIVNDTIISLTDIDRYKEKLKKGSVLDDLLVNPQEIDQILKDKDRLINLMIDEKILDSEVKKQGLNLTIEKVQKEIAGIAQKNNITIDQLKQALVGEGVRFSDYQDFVKTRMERQELIGRTVTSKIKISDEEISAYYVNSSGKQAESTFEYTVAHILFRSDKGGEEAAFERAKSVYLKLKDSPSAFEKLASEYSEDPSFNNGGLLGTFRAGELVGPIDKVVQRLNSGEVSKITQTKAGYHIVKLVTKKVVPDPKWERERQRIYAILSQQAFKKQFKFWLDQKRQEAFIRIND